MLRSASYFVGIECPLQSDRDGCGRPYCPFRHKASSRPLGSREITKVEEEHPGSSVSLDLVNEAIAKLKSDMDEDQDSIPKDEVFVDDYSPMINDAYLPEPYLAYSTQESAANLYTPGKKADKVVNYYPSKSKSVLHGARGPSKTTKTPVISRNKNIYESSSKIMPATDMEYDPIMNYATLTLENPTSKEDRNPGTSKRGHTSGGDYKIPVKRSKQEEENSEDSENDLQIAEDLEEEEGMLIIEDEENPKDPDKNPKGWLGVETDSDAECSSAKLGNNKTRTSEESILISSSDESEVNNNMSEENCHKDIIDSAPESGVFKEVIEISSDDNIKSKNTKTVSKSTKKSKHSSPDKKMHQKSKNKSSDKSPKNKSKSSEINSKKDKNETKTSEIKNKSKKKVEKNPKSPVAKGKVKKKDLKSTKKNSTIHAKDIDIADVRKLIDKDEIQKLEEELNGENRYEECLKIYHESVAEEKTKSKKSPTQNNTGILDRFDVEPEPVLPIVQTSDFSGKRRVAHAHADSMAVSLRKPIIARKRISTPAQMMMKRLEIIEKEKLALNDSSSSGRVAHKPSTVLSSSLSSKSPRTSRFEKKISENPWFPKPNTAKPEPTVCGTNNKGEVRVAHVGVSMSNRNGSAIPNPPRIAIDRHSKVPTNIRQRYLTTFIKECMRIFNDKHEKAYPLAQMEEEQCKKRSNSRNVYLSLAASTLKKLRDMPVCGTNDSVKNSKESNLKSSKVSLKKQRLSDSGEPPRKSAKVISHNNLLDVNTKKCKGGYTIEKREEKSALSDIDIYEKMCRYLMTPEQLDENRYPRPGDFPGVAAFNCDPPLKPFNVSNKKVCARCGKEFVLDKKGVFLREEECTHHWGRPYMTRVGRGWEKRYSCCQERIGSEGCTIVDTHAHADNKLDCTGYVKTMIKSPSSDGNPGIYTLDCEMSYTVKGLELTRVSVLDYNCKPVYESFVKPSGRILDYNTRWSGITEESLRNVKTTIRDVQAVFLAKFSSETILMGHSLESDLVALRIIHETVIDTAIVFPHKRGLPYKRALRNLASENLGLVIQNMASEGHDSAEDASACMKLMMWKLSEDEKLSN